MEQKSITITVNGSGYKEVLQLKDEIIVRWCEKVKEENTGPPVPAKGNATIR